MLRFAFRRGPGVRSFTAEAATKPKLTVSERVKGDKQGLVGVAASTLAFILSAQSFRMRNERVCVSFPREPLEGASRLIKRFLEKGDSLHIPAIRIAQNSRRLFSKLRQLGGATR